MVYRQRNLVERFFNRIKHYRYPQLVHQFISLCPSINRVYRFTWPCLFRDNLRVVGADGKALLSLAFAGCRNLKIQLISGGLLPNFIFGDLFAGSAFPVRWLIATQSITYPTHPSGYGPQDDEQRSPAKMKSSCQR